MAPAERRVRLGIAGLGRAFTLMLPTLARHPRVQLVAAADPRAEARARFAQDFAAATYDSVEALCADGNVDAVYVATPHHHHAEHVRLAAAAGKHVLVEKPMAITLGEAASMVDACAGAGVHLVVGHSHSFDAPIATARRLITSESLGPVRMITTLNFTDFLYRPRRPEELDTRHGGGVVFSQAAHQIDIVRLLGGGLVSKLDARTGAWDTARPTEGAYTAMLDFADGAFASIIYSGFAHFDSDELCGWVSEIGRDKDPQAYGAMRDALQQHGDARAEAAAKNARNYGGRAYRDASSDQPWHEHFGPLIVSCERGDLRPTPRGVWVYGDRERRFHALEKPAIPRTEVLDELCDAVLLGRAPLHDGRWGMATLECCLALLQSSRDGGPVALRHQVPVG